MLKINDLSKRRKEKKKLNEEFRLNARQKSLEIKNKNKKLFNEGFNTLH